MIKKWPSLKKIAEIVHQEVQNAIERIKGRYLAEKAATGYFDLESFEISIRSSMHHIGCGLLEQIINADGRGYRGRSIIAGEGHRHEFVEYRDHCCPVNFFPKFVFLTV